MFKVSTNIFVQLFILLLLILYIFVIRNMYDSTMYVILLFPLLTLTGLLMKPNKLLYVLFVSFITIFSSFSLANFSTHLQTFNLSYYIKEMLINFPMIILFNTKRTYYKPK